MVDGLPRTIIVHMELVNRSERVGEKHQALSVMDSDPWNSRQDQDVSLVLVILAGLKYFISTYDLKFLHHICWHIEAKIKLPPFRKWHF